MDPLTPHPACRELHVPPPGPATPRLTWRRYDGTPAKPAVVTCDRCTNIVYEFVVMTDTDWYAIIRTDISRDDSPVIFMPDDQGTALSIWLDLLNGKAI